VNYTYDFPKTRFGGLRGRIFNGYRLSGITTLQGGFPIAVFDGGVSLVHLRRYILVLRVLHRPNFNGGAVQDLRPSHRFGCEYNPIQQDLWARKVITSSIPMGFREKLWALWAMQGAISFFHGPGTKQF